MSFNTFFKLTSYAVVICGALALLNSGGISLFVAILFAVAIIVAWRLEDTKLQISERLGLVLIVLVLPLYYLDWQYQTTVLSREQAGAATLAHLILGLSVIKLLQTKADRDWIFIYLISFFEVLLAAGLSISPTFLATLILYLLFAASTIIGFEIRKAGRSVTILKADPQRNSIWRLSAAAATVLFLTAALALPMFFVMPRVGGAGYGGRGGGLSGFVGFSDSVRLGAIGTLQQSDEVVMRIRVEGGDATVLGNLRWRGVALDYFDNRNWRKSSYNNKTTFNRQEDGLFRFDTAKKAEDLLVQTVYLEPIDTPVLFGASRIIGVEGSFPTLNQDSENSIVLNRAVPERVVYKAYSDISQPSEQVLRRDNNKYSKEIERYLQLPTTDGERLDDDTGNLAIDRRIVELANKIVAESGAKNRYDKARAIENYLQTNFAYTLDLKVSGDEPVADFLFNIREGHCEYFATSLAVMLRSQGIAARVVNGFQTGDYNDAADAFIVSQRQAHSWVEVYFPESNHWAMFDPTPAVGRNLPASATSGNFLTAGFNKYLEAAEMFWLQYVVAYDSQEQRSLARTFREQLLQNQAQAQSVWQTWSVWLQDWWRAASGERGAWASLLAIGQIVLIVLSLGGLTFLAWFFGKRISWRGLAAFVGIARRGDAKQIVEFYERMIKALAKKNLKRSPSQTPLEFAAAVGANEAVKVTEAYNRVRFGQEKLSRSESVEIESWLRNLERKQPNI